MAKLFDLPVDKQIIESDLLTHVLRERFSPFSPRLIEKFKVQHFKFLYWGFGVLETCGCLYQNYFLSHSSTVYADFPPTPSVYRSLKSMYRFKFNELQKHFYFESDRQMINKLVCPLIYVSILRLTITVNVWPISIEDIS